MASFDWFNLYSWSSERTVFEGFQKREEFAEKSKEDDEKNNELIY